MGNSLSKKKSCFFCLAKILEIKKKNCDISDLNFLKYGKIIRFILVIIFNLPTFKMQLNCIFSYLVFIH